MLELLWEMQNFLAEIAGLDDVSLQPAAGAQGELAALLVAAAYFRDRGEKRSRVLIPDKPPTAPTSAKLPPSPASTPSASRATAAASSISPTSRPSSTTAPPCS